MLKSETNESMKPSAVFLTIGPWHEKPWWWGHVKNEIEGCHVNYLRIIPVGNKRESAISLVHTPQLIVKIAKELRRQKPRYVFTFECGWASFLLSGMQAFGFMKGSMRHVILQFIMREKTPTIRSKIKYLVMRIIFSSIHIAICSSSKETCYYRKVFKWKEGKACFVPLQTDPAYLQKPANNNEGFILTAGRTCRDYETFLDAVRKINYKVIMVVSPWNIDMRKVPENVYVNFDISMAQLTELMMKSAVVVVPLQDKRISIGQSVFLQAMAMGKPVVVTKTAGTVDYIEHLENGMLVSPKDSNEMRVAIQFLMENENERIKIGREAKNRIIRSHLPKHQIAAVRRLIVEKK